MKEMTVGELAAGTGVSVRTLHHYDSIGLLTPSGRTDAGYRLYAPGDVERLQRIVLLRNLNIPLTEIGGALESGGPDLLSLVERHAEEARARLAQAETLCARLDGLVERLRANEPQSLEQALETIEAVTLFERHFTRDQMEDIRERGRELGPERIREVEAEWPKLIAAVRHEMRSGTPASDPRMTPLAHRWQELVDEFVNGRWDIAAGVARVLQEPAARQRIGLDAEVMEYISQAIAKLPSTTR